MLKWQKVVHLYNYYCAMLFKMMDRKIIILKGHCTEVPSVVEVVKVEVEIAEGAQ